MITIEERFLAKVEKTATCWLWKACLIKDGYGRFGIGKKLFLAHRVSKHLFHGMPLEFEIGTEIDHLCKVRNCVNPDHLEVVSRAENYRRPLPLVCKNGHELKITSENGKGCKICNKEAQKAWRIAHPDRVRELCRLAQQRYRARLKGRVAL